MRTLYYTYSYVVSLRLHDTLPPCHYTAPLEYASWGVRLYGFVALAAGGIYVCARFRLGAASLSRLVHAGATRVFGVPCWGVCACTVLRLVTPGRLHTVLDAGVVFSLRSVGVFPDRSF